MPEESDPPKLKVLLDSNVIISGLTHGGNPRAILDLLWLGEIECFISPFILAEVGNSLSEDFGWSDSAAGQALSILQTHCVVIDPPQDASLSQLSPADNRILDCAVQGQVQYLVTGDRALQGVGDYHGIQIISPIAFLQIL